MSTPTFQQTLPASAVANQLIEWSLAEDKPIDTLAMHKLVFLCHGWHLGLTMRPLLRESIVAWGYGPLIESLYHVLQKDVTREITKKILVVGWNHGKTSGIPTNHPAYKLVREVWKKYSRYNSKQLSTITHEEGTPWHTLMLDLKLVGQTELDGVCPIIPDAMIADFYAKLANEAKSSS